MSSLLSIQLGPLKFYRNPNTLKYYYNKESGFIYDVNLCCIVGKKVDGKHCKLSEEDKKWCGILKNKVIENDPFFKMVCLTDDLAEKHKLGPGPNKRKENEILLNISTEVMKTNKETLEKIRNFQTQDELIEHVKKYPKHIHDCLYNCDWKVFNLNVVKTLVQLKLLDPIEKSPAYDGDDGYQNLNFYEHLKLQLEELPIQFIDQTMINNRIKVISILDYLKKN